MRIDEKLRVIYETIAPTITRSEEAWKDYLRFGSNVYKHPFDNALLVYAQNPKATMLATASVWNSKKVGRYINKGEKGISVCEYSNAKHTIKHLFDIMQTNGESSPSVWRLDDKLKQGLIHRLTYSHDITAATLTDCIGQIVAYNIADSIDDYLLDFENDVKDHFLSTIPHGGLISELAETIYNSCVYYIANRCGETTDVSMPTISHFDTIPLVARLGYTVTELSKGILLEIERNVKILNNERSVNNEPRTIKPQETPRTAEQPERWRDDRVRGSAPWEIRQDGDEAPTRNQSPKIFTFEDARRAYEPDVSGRRGSDGEGRVDNTEATTERSDAADGRHIRTDAPSEQAQGHSRGNRDPRDGIDNEITKLEIEPQGSFSMPVDDHGIQDKPKSHRGKRSDDTEQLSLFSSDMQWETTPALKPVTQISMPNTTVPRTLDVASDGSGGIVEISIDQPKLKLLPQAPAIPSLTWKKN